MEGNYVTTINIWVPLDDPSFVLSVNVALFEKEGAVDLVWSRVKGK